MTKPLKIIFAGTPPFAATILKALLNTSHTISAVYTQPDRPAGRGQHLHASAVKQVAEEKNILIRQPLSLRDETEQTFLKSLQADLMIVVAYGLILPTDVLNTPRLGCINVHASLLPRWRGAAPIQQAILAGDTQTGITLMQMDAGLDTGPMLVKTTCDILPDDTSQELHDRLAQLGADSLVKLLSHLETIRPEIQNNDLATYAHKITKQQARIEWQKKAIELDRLIRAFNPAPIAFTYHNEQPVRVWQAKILNDVVSAAPGTITAVNSHGITVATTEGQLQLTKIQLPGGKPLLFSEIFKGKPHLFQVDQVLK